MSPRSLASKWPARKRRPKAGPRSPLAAADSEIIAALQTADPAQGEKDVALCKVCHSFDKGGPTMIGPNLYGVVGHKIASHEGVNYTAALKGKEGDWTFENLDHWLTNPQAFAPGTSMAFPGIPDLKKRADVIAYLNKNSDSPLPIPEPKARGRARGSGRRREARSRRRQAGDPRADRHRRSGEGRGERRSLQGLPYGRQGRRHAGRPQSVGRRRAQDRRP